jgi:TonB family protein
VRYLLLRVLLVICLALPFVQPRIALPGPAGSRGTPAATQAVSTGPSRGGAPVSRSPWLPPDATIVAAVIGGGALLRLLWMATGIARLRRLRRAGVVADASHDHDELQQVITGRATIRYVPGLGQPVTFGFRSPVILLPSAVRDLPMPIQRAVLAHELWHVQRADWLSTLCEEAVRAVLWFHPAVGTLVSRIQSAREEVVDELAILTTGSRRTYVNALLAFADAPSSVAAPAFARRRHLVRRLVLISKEVVMSGRRVVVSAAAVGALVLGSAWYSVQAFPMRGDQLPADALTGVPGPMERQANRITPENPVPRRTHSVPAVQPEGLAEFGAAGTVSLRVTLDGAGRVAETRIASILFRRNNQMALQLTGPTRESLDRMMNGSYRLSPGEPAETMQRPAQLIDAMMASAVQAVQQWQYSPPAEAPIAFDVAVHFGPPPPPPLPPPPAGVSGKMPPTAPATSPRPGPMPAPPPPAPGDTGAVRVGGAIKAPFKVRNVNPVYPQDAQDARVQGVVIIEARIEADGTVGRARVLRSIPMLDEAALDAVRQWEFTPTLVNGAAVPVIMTVTVNFTLQ